MIHFQQASAELLKESKQHHRNFKRTLFFTFSLVALALGAFFKVWDLVLYFMGGSFILFYGILSIFTTAPANEKSITKQNTIAGMKVTVGFEIRLKSLTIALQSGESLPEGIQDRTNFIVLDYVVPSILNKSITYESAKDYIGKSAEVKFLEKSGYIVELNFVD